MNATTTTSSLTPSTLTPSTLSASTRTTGTTASARTARSMVAGTAAPSPTTSPIIAPTTETKSLWRTGLVAGLGAAAATTAVAAVARAIDVPIETAPGEAIPILGFAQLTMFFTVVGLVIATVLRRKARDPRSAFVTTALVLTALSVVPDVVLSTDLASKLTLVLTHFVAAAIVIPRVASVLPDDGPNGGPNHARC
jgi:hypothetical protein